MNKWEEDMIEQIRKESEDIQIPDSLRPDQIESGCQSDRKRIIGSRGIRQDSRQLVVCWYAAQCGGFRKAHREYHL